MSTISIRHATKSDSDELMEMIHELAVYEKMEDMLAIRPEFLANEIINGAPHFICFVAENESGQLIGYCALYLTMSLFL